MKESIRFSREGDAEFLAPILREEDKREVLAAGSTSPLAALQLGFEVSTVCLTVEDENGDPCMMFGVGPTSDPNFGVIWLLSSDIITRKPMTFLRQSKLWLPFFHSKYPLLGNAVDARNEVHVKWLRWLGFKFINTLPMNGPDGPPFHVFVRLHHV